MAAADASKTAADAGKATADQFSAAGNEVFKDAVERTLTVLNDTNAYSKQNLEAVVASVTAAAKGAEALGAQAMALSKKSLEDQVSAAQSLAGAKSFQDVLDLQTAYARTAMETYMAEVNKFSETFSSVMKDSMKPLNERMTATVERFQSAR